MIMKMANYPYEERFAQLREFGNHDAMIANYASPNAFCKFTTFLGSVYDGPGREMNGAISAIVQRGYSNVHADVRTSMAPPGQPQSPQHPTLPALDENYDGFQTNDANMPRYTTALKEYGDRRELMISWSTKQISMMPIKFRCVAQIEDRVFNGTAGNKREAKHIASREACNALGISL